MSHGLSATTVARIQAVLARYPHVTKAVLYGSRAKGTFKPGSDIDLALYGDALDSRELGVLEDALDELMLPYSIDLSLFASVDHTPLRAHIERVGQEFYRRPSGGTCGAPGPEDNRPVRLASTSS